MQTKFTPGPWHIKGLQHGDQWKILGGDNRIVGEASHHCVDADANARLIAAAPELYAAAVLALDMLANLTSEQFSHGEDKPARDALGAALAKVNG